MSKHKFAAFDIDGTIFRWQLYHALFDEFCRRGIISADAAKATYKARQEWQHRNTEFDDYEEVLIQAVEPVMLGLSEATLNEAADHILATTGGHVYRYTSQLLQDLKKQGYVIIAISGSHQQLVERFAKRYSIDIIHGRQYEIKGGVVTGNPKAVYGHKAAILKQIVAEHDLSWDDSYAVGDTNSDGDMMELVTNPIAFNPDRALYERARRESWPIVVERKSVIYELKPDGTTHVLA